MKWPSVSLIMPVGYGERYFRVALGCALGQDYKGHLTLVLVDNSVEPVLAIKPHGYFRAARGSVGYLRNYGTARATGDVCISWDEDDWSAPNRVAEQVKRLLDTGKAVTGWHSLLFHDTTYDESYRYDRGTPGMPYALGTSQCYWREWWTHHPFPDGGYEDLKFGREAREHGMLDSCDAGSLCVARAHADSTCPPNFKRCAEFTPVPRSKLPNGFFEAIK